MSDDLNWEGTNTLVDQVDDIVGEALGYSEEEAQGQSILNEAIERIEQAKLYESLIKHDFFGPGSARPEIQSRVTKEIRGFILERLEILLGIKTNKVTETNTIHQTVSPFDNEEVDALKEIAGRLILKSRNSGTMMHSEPQVKQFQNQQPNPQVNRVTPSQPRVNQVSTQKQPQQPPRRPSAPVPSTPIAEMTPEERLASGVYKPQAVSKIHPPKPMPSQMQINAMNAEEVSKRQSKGTGSITDQILRLAISSSQETNASVIESLNDPV